ncbi:MAG: type III pantothenate kinase [Campylobacterota bacterium]|nr:type III pantothenate kinase [Campylobacterota bacterium]
MLLCDIGNTSYHFYDAASDYKEDVQDFNPLTCKEQVYYINVNATIEKQLNRLDNWIDLSLHVNWQKYYPTMGIDRIMACEAVENALIIDAGSAITVDIVKDTLHQGGFITPGVEMMGKSYKRLSSRLDYSFNFDLDLDKMPKNSQDAISYGFLGILRAEVMRHEMPIILTGGDARRLQKIFPEASIDTLLLFRGMKRLIKKGRLC